MQHFNEDFCVYYKYTTCFGIYQPSSGVDSTLFIYANLLKAMALGNFSYQAKLRVAMVVRHKQKYVTNIIYIYIYIYLYIWKNRRFLTEIIF
jgi:hypothetical protein